MPWEGGVGGGGGTRPGATLDPRLTGCISLARVQLTRNPIIQSARQFEYHP